MQLTIKEYLAPGRAIAIGENKDEYRVSIPVNRGDLVVGSKIAVKPPKEAKKSIGVTKLVDGKLVTTLETIGFKESVIDLDATDKKPEAVKK